MSEITLFIVTFCVLMLAFGGLAIGLMQGKELKGSCGGLSSMTGERCDFCGNDQNKCDSPKA
jgi:hypothetical protein